MDTQPSENVRATRNRKIIAAVAVVIFLLALALSIGGRRNAWMRNGKEVGIQDSNRVEMSKPIGSVAGAPDTTMYSGKQDFMPAEGMATDTFQDLSGGANVATDAKVMKTADMTLKVESIEKAVADFRAIAERLGGSILSSSLSDMTTSVPNSEKSGMVAMKVPANRFDEALQNIRSAANVVVYESTSGQDVSREYVDLQARLKNKQTEEESIAAILTRDTNKIDDVLRVTMELARVRGEIEQLQAQIKYLDNQTEMSTITVSFTEDAKIGGTTTGWRPGQDVKDAVNALIKAGQKMISFLISFVIAVLPILAILIAIFGVILYVIAKRLREWMNK